MTKILFLCHGNICRSPMAEIVMKDLVQKAGLERQITVDSAALRTDAIGESVYPPARRTILAHGLACPHRAARLAERRDYEAYDRIIGMDSENLRDMHRLFGTDPDGKLQLLMDYTGQPRPVSDPWYTDDFEATWRDVNEGCRALLEDIKERKQQ